MKDTFKPTSTRSSGTARIWEAAEGSAPLPRVLKDGPQKRPAGKGKSKSAERRGRK